MSGRKDQQTTAVREPLRPPYVAGSFGDVLDDFRENIKLSVKEMDEIVLNYGFTGERLEPMYNLLKILWSYQMRKNLNSKQSKTEKPE